ncbi:competence type IV pilus minor pilin ComGD [Carnobacterium funditum]|uniref:competence type IV pilus minor pilin ComGD n=1 Tax=Carnobacterium funditum TaxID=2752 RepID=UPI000550DDEA|nr:competence type IV pilus minor pilin ComGD [Carnobacterium funditum]
MKKINSSGLLLFEMLVVLFIATSMLIIPTIFSKKIIENTATQLFVEELQSGITTSQNYAVLSGKWSSIDVSARNNDITFKAMSQENHYLEYRLQLPKNITTPSNKQYIFNGGSGNLQSFSTLYFDIDGIRHGLIFQMGSGRYKWE